MSEIKLVPSSSNMDLGVTESYVEDRNGDMAPGVQIRLAKRFVRPGSKKVTCLAAQTTVPLHDDERASVSNLALKLSDGTNVVLSLSFFEDGEAPHMGTMPVADSFAAPKLNKPKADWSLGKILVAMTLGAALGTWFSGGDRISDLSQMTNATGEHAEKIVAKVVPHKKHHSTPIAIKNAVPPPPPAGSAIPVVGTTSTNGAQSHSQNIGSAVAPAIGMQTAVTQLVGIPITANSNLLNPVSNSHPAMNMNSNTIAAALLANLAASPVNPPVPGGAKATITSSPKPENSAKPTPTTTAAAAASPAARKSEMTNPMQGWKTFFSAYTKHIAPDKKKANPLKVASKLRVPPPPPTPPSVGTYQWQLVATPRVTKTGAVSYMVTSTPTIQANSSNSADAKKSSAATPPVVIAAKSLESALSKPVIDTHGFLPAASAKSEEHAGLIPSASAKGEETEKKSVGEIANLPVAQTVVAPAAHAPATVAKQQVPAKPAQPATTKPVAEHAHAKPAQPATSKPVVEHAPAKPAAAKPVAEHAPAKPAPPATAKSVTAPAKRVQPAQKLTAPRVLPKRPMRRIYPANRRYYLY
jgi:hypothetical protein